ncbi:MULTISPECIES: hypothetical protein [unclassified Campylobacter]|uniref:CiaD-like domain-containing protein n=1 Tax=unclassified Campylobacter TaxID=2593542 RepID=UPI00147458DA|nr:MULTISPECIES: hypothetical protein [unclassified Campylobacter]
MKLEDIAKMAIDEVAAELKEISSIEHHTTKNEQIKDEPEAEKFNINGEEIFLKNLKERILVLFEGLNVVSRENLEDRLELTLKFLEFVLANVENRLDNLKTK